MPVMRAPRWRRARAGDSLVSSTLSGVCGASASPGPQHEHIVCQFIRVGSGSHLRNMCTGHRSFDDVERGVHAAGDRKRRSDAPGEDRHPTQAKAQFRRAGEEKCARGAQLFRVDVGLIEAIDERSTSRRDA